MDRVSLGDIGGDEGMPDEREMGEVFNCFSLFERGRLNIFVIGGDILIDSGFVLIESE